jgi:hypothetical protein
MMRVRDYEPVMHLSLSGGPHPEEWVAGATCDACQEYQQRLIEQKHRKAPNVNLGWLAQERETGITQQAMGREIQQTAKAEGREIQRAGRAWS